MKKKGLVGLIASGLVTLGGTLAYINNYIPVDIPAGEYRISENPLRSDGFSICSGVILDYGNGAIMAHAPPSRGSYPPIKTNHLNARNVVDILTKELENRNIDPKKCQAIINAGVVESSYRIRQDLQNKGIPIKESSLEAKGRNLTYNPKTDELTVEYISSK